MKVWHVTEIENLDDILKNGLMKGKDIKERIIEKIYASFVDKTGNFKEDMGVAIDRYKKGEYFLKDRYNFIWFYNNFKEAIKRAKKRYPSIVNYLQFNEIKQKNNIILEIEIDENTLKKMNIVKHESPLLQLVQKIKPTRLVSVNEVKNPKILKIYVNKNTELKSNNYIVEKY